MRTPATVVAMVVAGMLLSAARAHCPNFCSGHGICDSTSETCACFDGWRGYDCRDRVCPLGGKWAGYPSETDVVHTDLAECSGVGECDRATGLCSCPALYRGDACEFLTCAEDCSGHGVCTSLRNAAEQQNGHSLVRQMRYDEPWDADRIFGCACDPGWGGYDCSLRECPHGDDPLTTGQVDEVQVISCSCPGDRCTGFFTLSFMGRQTAPIYHDAVGPRANETQSSSDASYGRDASVESKLETLRTLDGVIVTVNSTAEGAHGFPVVCAPESEGGALWSVTFNEYGGNVPALVVSNQVYGVSDSTGNQSLATIVVSTNGVNGSVAGTTEHIPCSGRGVCDTNTGACVCFAGYGGSDGDGNMGTRADCGYAMSDVTDCPNSLERCSGRGVCDSERVVDGHLAVVWNTTDYENSTFEFQCSCYDGYTGGDCSLRSCPTAPAWWDEPFADQRAHADAECGNMGICNRVTGLCECRDGFTGDACERQECLRGANGLECSGRGQCLTLAQLALVSTRGGERQGTDEVQVVNCTLSEGLFALRVDHHQSKWMDWNATTDTVRSTLEALPTAGFVNVSYDVGTAACSSSSVSMTVTFVSDGINVAEIVPVVHPDAVGDITVETIVDGSRITYGRTEADHTVWDAHRIFGCHCDGKPDYNKTRPIAGSYTTTTRGTSYVGYEGGGLDKETDLGLFEGPTCALRTCPYGPDPMDESLGDLEVQRLTCAVDPDTAANTTSLRFVHMGVSSGVVDLNTTAAGLKQVLQSMPSIGLVNITVNSTEVADGAGNATTSAKICAVATSEFPNGAETTITFTTELGDLPLLSAVLSEGNLTLVATEEVTKGTRVNVECSGRGICDPSTGICQCFTGYFSSDGAGNPGKRGDCGAIEHFYISAETKERLGKLPAGA